MADRLHIEITGDLPDAGKFAILASAEDAAKDFAASLAAKHPGLELKVSVKAVRPGKKATTPLVPSEQSPATSISDASDVVLAGMPAAEQAPRLGRHGAD